MTQDTPKTASQANVANRSTGAHSFTPTPPTDGLRSGDDFPSGAIYNGIAFMERLEVFHDDSNRKLIEEYDWYQVKLCFNHLVEYVQEQQNALASQSDTHKKELSMLLATNANQLSLLLEQSEKLRVMRELLRRYRTEVPLGNQPHMIAHVVDAALADKE